ncbi:hypothetical protein [Gordonia sp. (in: high G+C Gram-positive bacteria)]|uniref:hypothetical protein n=1 Tax=Gordonia sp. (in: high G+C Gram-positive bacteria) TaxID=84139 RepID=UPI0039E46C7B
MAVVIADSESIDQFANNVNQLVEAAFAVIECLSVSGNHGTRQGLTVQAAVTEFQATLGPELTKALSEVADHAYSTAAIAGAVRQTEAEMTAVIGAYIGKAETTLLASGSKVL